MAITTCTVTGNVKSLLNSGIADCTIRVSTASPFMHSGSFISGQVAQVSTSATGDFSIGVIETTSVNQRLVFTFQYYDGIASRKQKSFSVIVPNQASALISDLINAAYPPATNPPFPAKLVSVTPAGNQTATNAQAAIDLIETQVTGNTASIVTNTASIVTNAANTATNTANIATNTANVVTNTANIATNTANIATNTASIAAKAPIASPTFTGTVTGTFAGNLTGNASGSAASFTGNLSGDVTGTQGATVLGANVVTNAKAAQMAANTIKGNNTGATSNASDLTAAQTAAMLPAVVGDTGSGGTKGLVPAPASGDAAAGRFLKADGTWAAPSGAGTVTSVSVTTANGVSGTVATATSTPAITLTLGAITPTSVNGNTISAGTGTLSLGANTLTVAGTASVSGTHSGTSSGTNTGDQTITLSGDISGSGTGAITTAIGALKVTSAMLAGSIAYSKLSLTGAILNADLAGSIASSKLVGSDIATVGTITAGTWTGTAIAATSGGTAQTTYALGDTLYSSAANTLSKLSGNTSAVVAGLYQTGTGSVSAAPAWQTIPSARYVNATATISGTASKITYSTKDYDTNNAYVSGVFTVPAGASGKYQINAGLIISATYTAGQGIALSIVKNGTAITNVATTAPTYTGNVGSTIADCPNLAVGDTIQIQASTTATSPTLTGSATYNFFSIIKVSP
jgi:hypothetical protein